MRAQIAAALLALAAPLHAIKITSPAKNDVVDPAAGVTVKWTTVNTDPTTAHLVLVNMASGHTPYNKDLGEVDLSKGSFTVTESDVPDDEAYQFNFESVQKQNTGILAQSEQFEVKAGESDDDKTTTTKTTQTTESVTVKTSTLKATSTITKSDTTVTSTATTLATVSETVSRTGSATGTASSSTSTGAAAPTGAAVKAGSLVALVAGVAAVLA
ncbi:hypothetical protein NEMBOFW57_000071 [Staphylotrichum longicolle]|jgi:hypothetical protein|uniref:Yeast cell wall synthesis Kre9/Knh1-like N-terminal domain-containing protein n=1 Tax=Staphylotrichum longicolle TaxID=669026 RepID=A0AAD4F237_9PEZI|nr:hypothetical protein NEMBOFW57_000071 [Staphylotrichum longicolle]